MISIRADTKAKNLAKISRFKKKLDDSLNKQYRQKVLMIFKDLLTISPQYSGDFVSNWRVVSGTEQLGGYQQWARKGLGFELSRTFGPEGKMQWHRETNVVQAGDSTAIDFAFTRAKFVKYNYLQKVYFINETPLDFTATTVTDHDGNTQALRDVNVIRPAVQMLSYIKAKYRT